MIYPIVAYGDPILRERAAPIKEGTKLQGLIDDMFATMVAAGGVGLAAPQIGKSIRLFVADLTPCTPTKGNAGKKYRHVFINPVLYVDQESSIGTYDEGCLSIPNIPVSVPRRDSITIRYFDIQWQWHQEKWSGFSARIIQHEYDHLEGKLHIDYAAASEREPLEEELNAISQGKVGLSYKMHFFTQTG